MGIGKRLKEARELRGLTQEELGRLVGVTGSAITNYEKEVSHPKEPVMYALFKALDVEPNFLFQDCIESIKKDPANRSVDEARAWAIAAIDQMSDEDFEAVAPLLRRFEDKHKDK